MMDTATCPPCNHDCDQSDTCPARTGSCAEPAKVAPVRKSKRRTCEELGICQCEGSVCTNGLGARGENPDDPDDGGVWFEIAYWGSNLLVAAMTTTVVFGVAGYLFSRFGG